MFLYCIPWKSKVIYVCAIQRSYFNRREDGCLRLFITFSKVETSASLVASVLRGLCEGVSVFFILLHASWLVSVDVPELSDEFARRSWRSSVPAVGRAKGGYVSRDVCVLLASSGPYDCLARPRRKPRCDLCPALASGARPRRRRENGTSVVNRISK